MKDREIYIGFSKEKQSEYQKYLINRFGGGEKAKNSMKESIVNFNNLNKEDFEKSKTEWDEICNDLAKYLKSQAIASSSEVQKTIQRHYKWIEGYWTPDRDSYSNLGEQYMGFEWKKAFAPYDSEHPKLAQFLAEEMKIFAEVNCLE